MKMQDILKQNPLVLAPMAGITNLPFRLICKELGAGLVFSEMVSAEALIRKHRRTIKLLQSNQIERPIVFQIFGSNVDSMAEAASIVSQGHVDFIDINMGCPVPKILKSGAGAALLRNIERAEKIMIAVVKASKVPVTIKIRLGWDTSTVIAVELAQAAESAGITAVTVHGRTKMQGFSGRADWGAIRLVKNSVNVPVIGNGDVRIAQDVKKMMDETGCDGVMIGRAIQGYPWIFREAKQYLESGFLPAPPTSEERRIIMLRHLYAMIELCGEKIGISEMRKYLCWYTKKMHGATEFRKRVMALQHKEEIIQEINKYFNRLEINLLPV